MNPELQRNLWLEATPRRLVWIGAAVGLVYVAALLAANGMAPGLNGSARAAQIVGAGLFVIAGFIWGPREAGQAVLVEIGQRTWDFQRLSALTPWSMAWGKLLGSTAVPWLVALTGLIGATPGGIQRMGALDWAHTVVTAIGIALILQAGAMALALVSVRKARAEGRLATMRGVAGGLFGFIVFIWLVGNGISLGFVLLTGGQSKHIDWSVLDFSQWWGMPVDPGAAFALSAAIYAGWAMVAAWRLMRLELQMRNGPWTWVAFLLFSAVFLAGFAAHGGPAAEFAVAAGVFATGAYAAAFAEPTERTRLRHFSEALRRFDIGRMMMTASAVFSPAKLMFWAVVGFALSPAAAYLGQRNPAAFGFAALAFLIRDLGVIFFFRYGPRPGRGDFGAVLALFMLYGVGGLLGSVFGHEPGRAMFAPDPNYPLVSLAAATILAVVAWVLALPRMRAPEQKAA